MHVHTITPLSPEAVKARFKASTTADAEKATNVGKLTYASDRIPPKFFLASAPVTLPAAAEVALNDQAGGTEVVLRLMWGALPAPFPRAVAGVGVLIGLLILLFSDRTVGDWLLATLVIVLPVAALMYQQKGERELQAQLSARLDGASFTPKPH